MKIKNYKNTPNKISYTACYDCLEMEIIHERTEFGVRTTDIEDFLEKVSMYSYEDADAIEAFKDFQNNLVLEDVEFEIETAEETKKMKYKVTVYYDNMLYSEHIFSNKNDAINELHRLRGVKYRNARKYKVEMVEVNDG